MSNVTSNYHKITKVTIRTKYGSDDYRWATISLEHEHGSHDIAVFHPDAAERQVPQLIVDGVRVEKVTYEED